MGKPVDETMLNLYDRHLKGFWTVAEKGSFLAASRELYISQPALTKQINLLEEQLGFRLFERSNKGARLTEAGRKYREETVRIAEDYRNLLESCRRMSAGEKKELKVGYYSNVRSSFSLTVADALRRESPELEIRLKELSLESCAEDLLAGKIDVFTGYDSRAYDREDIVFEPLSEWDYYCIVPTEHPLSAREFLTPEDLVGEKIMIAPYGFFRGTDELQDFLAGREPGTDIASEVFNNSTFLRSTLQGRIMVNFGYPVYDKAYVTRPFVWERKAVHGIVHRKGADEAVALFVRLAREEQRRSEKSRRAMMEEDE